MTNLKMKCVHYTQQAKNPDTILHVYAFVPVDDNPIVSGKLELTYLDKQGFRVMGDYNLSLSGMLELASLN